MEPDDQKNQDNTRRPGNFNQLGKEFLQIPKHQTNAMRSSTRPSENPSLTRIPARSKSIAGLSSQKHVGKHISAPRLAQAQARTDPKDSTSTTCSICLNTISDAAVADNCMHQFCRSCIVEWARRSNLCPVCRTSLSFILFNIKSDREFETIPVQQPRPPVYNMVREVTVSSDGRNATVRTRYSIGNGVQEVTEVRDLNSSRGVINPRIELHRNSLFDIFFRDIMNNQYEGGYRFPHNPSLRAPLRIPGVPPIVPTSIEPPPFPMDPRAPSTSNRPPLAQNSSRALTPHYSPSGYPFPSIPQTSSVPCVFLPIPFHRPDGLVPTPLAGGQLNQPPSSEGGTSHDVPQQARMPYPKAGEFQHSLNRFKKSRDSMMNSDSDQNRSESSDQGLFDQTNQRRNI